MPVTTRHIKENPKLCNKIIELSKRDILFICKPAEKLKELWGLEDTARIKQEENYLPLPTPQSNKMLADSLFEQNESNQTHSSEEDEEEFVENDSDDGDEDFIPNFVKTNSKTKTKTNKRLRSRSKSRATEKPAKKPRTKSPSPPPIFSSKDTQLLTEKLNDKAGKTKLINVTKQPPRFPMHPQVFKSGILSADDIRERKRVEKAREESAARLKRREEHAKRSRENNLNKSCGDIPTNNINTNNGHTNINRANGNNGLPMNNTNQKEIRIKPEPQDNFTTNTNTNPCNNNNNNNFEDSETESESENEFTHISPPIPNITKPLSPALPFKAPKIEKDPLPKQSISSNQSNRNFNPLNASYPGSFTTRRSSPPRNNDSYSNTPRFDQTNTNIYDNNSRPSSNQPSSHYSSHSSSLRNSQPSLHYYSHSNPSRHNLNTPKTEPKPEPQPTYANDIEEANAWVESNSELVALHEDHPFPLPIPEEPKEHIETFHTPLDFTNSVVSNPRVMERHITNWKRSKMQSSILWRTPDDLSLWGIKFPQLQIFSNEAEYQKRRVYSISTIIAEEQKNLPSPVEFEGDTTYDDWDVMCIPRT